MDRILQQQQNELTEYFIYSKLAERISNKENKQTLLAIADQELEHHDFWKKITKQESLPQSIYNKKTPVVSQTIRTLFFFAIA